MKAGAVIFLGLAVLIGCSSFGTHIPYYIELPESGSRSACGAAVKHVERFALAAGYHRVRESSRGDRLALYQRPIRSPDISMAVLHRDGRCEISVSRIYSDDPVTVAELKRLYTWLRSTGVSARFVKATDQRELVEVIDYGR
jgi:hypothetical protein